MTTSPSDPAKDVMTHEEFARMYGQDLGRKELVVLTEHDGEHWWSKRSYGWQKLED